MGRGSLVLAMAWCMSALPPVAYGGIIECALPSTHVMPILAVNRHKRRHIRKNSFHIMALLHVLTQHNNALHVLLMLEAFSQDILGKYIVLCIT